MMEEHRCRIAAIEMEDSRCQSMLTGVVVEFEDQRCRSLNLRAEIEVEDRRCNRVENRMEDPRCASLRANW